MITYTGIIDSLGLESFVDKSKTNFPFGLRAMFNPQRTPIVYECQPTKKQVETIMKLLGKEFYTMAEKAVKGSRNYKIVWKK
jgi:hypothetical protein